MAIDTLSVRVATFRVILTVSGAQRRRKVRRPWYGIAHKKLAAQSITVFRSYVNQYCTSLEMAGASLTLLKVDDELKGLLTAPAEISNRVFSSTHP